MGGRGAKQRYYAALEHQRAAQRVLKERDGREMDTVAAAKSDDLYTDLGMRTYRVVENFLASLGDSGSLPNSGSDGQWARLETALARAVQPLAQELAGIKDRLDRQESRLNEVAAGIRRIDRFTLEAFQRLNEGEGAMVESPRPTGGPVRSPAASQRRSRRVRLPKEETITRSLTAARELQGQGRKLTLKAVAQAAGLKYSQIVYAFGSRDGLLDRLADNESLSA